MISLKCYYSCEIVMFVFISIAIGTANIKQEIYSCRQDRKLTTKKSTTKSEKQKRLTTKTNNHQLPVYFANVDE